MRKTLMLTAAPILAGALAAAPAFASGDNASDVGTQTQATATVHHGDQYTDAQKTLRNAAKVVDKMKSDPHMASLLKKSKGVFIVPHLWKGAFIVGGTGGEGVLMLHKAGHWTSPVFYGVGSVTFGAQAGGAEGPVAFLLMSNKAAHSFSADNNFSLNANAGLTIVNYSAKGQASAGKGDIVSWSNQGGAYAGAAVSGTDINPDDDMNQAYYHRQKVTPDEILAGNVRNPHANVLQDTLPG